MEVERAELEKQLEILKARYDAIPKTHEHLVNNGGGISKTVCLDEPRSETSSQNVLTQEQTGWRAENLNNRFRDKPQNVLFVYPRRMSSKEVGVCFDAACSQVLKKNDNLNIIWAGSPIVESSGDSLMISSADVNMMGRCYEFCPEMAKFLESSKAGQRPFKAKMYPHSEIKWTMQQEFQDPRAYDIVILPCSSPTDETQPDFELEKFTIDHSPVPVVFVRN